MPHKSTQEYVLLPPPALAGEQNSLTHDIASFFTLLHRAVGADPIFQLGSLFDTFLGGAVASLALGLQAERPQAELRVIDSVFMEDAKLVEMAPESISMLRAILPGVTVAPVIYGYPAVPRQPALEDGGRRMPRKSGPSISIKVVSAADGRPVADAWVIAYTKYARVNGVPDGEYVRGKTNARGVARLNLGAAHKKLSRLHVLPAAGFWDFVQVGVTIQSGTEIQLAPLVPGADALCHFYPNSPLDAGRNVKVGVVDTGVDAHPDLVIDGGRNTYTGEDPNDYSDNGIDHGTHVAGIIAARGAPPHGARGIAPGVTLRSYRVFPKGQMRTLNFYIGEGIKLAAEDGCDLINVSLTINQASDSVIDHSIAVARSKGAVVIAAVGNDDRGPVRYPALNSLAIGVAAFGRKGTFHASSSNADEVAAPYGKSKNNFVARFSNVGPEVDLIAPGVGIISTVAKGYAAKLGTSMACPAVTGHAARLLSTPPHSALLAMSRVPERADEVSKLILNSASSLGFGRTYEGCGMLLPGAPMSDKGCRDMIGP